MKFKKVELHAFRAYKNKDNGTFDFTFPNDKIANFISIYAPNGFGKTSFYDGVEWAVTKNISRLDIYKKISDAERKFIEKKSGNREKQYILKNKFVDDNTKGYVKVWTDRKEFENTIPAISRAGGKDYFSSQKSINSYFKDVILSQDGIDNFLKADDDKERYTKFISHFGDKTLANYYSNIEKLEKKNNQEKEEIKKEKEKIEKRLNVRIDDSIFKSTNKIIEEINLKNSEKLDLIDDSFDEIKKSELETKLLQEKKNLSELINYFESKLIPELPHWLEESEIYFKDKQSWEKLKNKSNDYVGLLNTTKNIKIIQDLIDTKKLEKEKLTNLRKKYPKYEAIESEIRNIEIRIKELNNAKIKYEKNLDKIEVAYNELSIKVERLEKEKREIDKLLIDIPKIYENIEKLQRYVSDIKIFRDALVKYDHIKEAIKSNIFIDIRSDDRYKLKVEKIESLIQKNTFNEEKLTALQHKKNEHQQYNRELRNLISLGIQIIDETQNDTCPLCNTKQDSYDALKNKVLNNPLLNTLEKEILKEEEKIQYIINTNNKIIEDEKKFIIQSLNNEFSDTKNKIDKLEYQIKSLSPNILEEDKDSLLLNLIRKTEAMSQDELTKLKKKEQNTFHNSITELKNRMIELKIQEKERKENILLIEEALKIHNKSLNKLKNEEEYLAVYNYINKFEAKIDVLEQINNNIESIDKLLNIKNLELDNLNNEKSSIVDKYTVENLDNLDVEIKLLDDEIFKLYSRNILTYESMYEKFFKEKITNIDNVKNHIKAKEIELNTRQTSNKKIVNSIEIIEKNIDTLLKFIENKKMKQEFEKYDEKYNIKIKVASKLSTEKKKLEEKINKDIEEFFHEDLINQIYEKIDPHPDYKKVKFECHFENGVGKLNVFVDNDNGTKHISPALYYSTAQLNVLSLSIFLAKALQTKDENGNNVDCIFIDDPIQSMDSINILATIDLLRSFIANHNKQIILSTHDENFYYLLKKKIPTEYFDSRFIELETYGKVKR
ncbi:hypothetical protein [Sulfurovum sp. NBC37-1]|uniref:hypothetical protein n=1 Tax=Sulfurovum sp. (strain NBC37-1) TaxID=387093 RepID=UPI0001587868|nr:hypothetical protein [Sulfurovum sp. NBC37-1]BAF71691.1 conserved hypothetical protein [Sulfurovum sp. NBC37-1]